MTNNSTDTFFRKGKLQQISVENDNILIRYTKLFPPSVSPERKRGIGNIYFSSNAKGSCADFTKKSLSFVRK